LAPGARPGISQTPVVAKPSPRLIGVEEWGSTDRGPRRLRPRLAGPTSAAVIGASVFGARRSAPGKQDRRKHHRNDQQDIEQPERVESGGVKRSWHCRKATALRSTLIRMAATEAKLPRSVRKGPLITVTCECGQHRELRYGERWRCEGCGRRYDTGKIPLEEYAAIRRTQLRYRMFPLFSCLLLLVGMIIFWATGRVYGAIAVVPFLIASWAIFGRPLYRSRYRRAIAKNLPTWNIKAD